MQYLIPVSMDNNVDLPKNIIESVRNELNHEIVGYDSIKKLIIKIIEAGINKPNLKKVNLLLTGEKSTGKTAIMDAMIKGIGEQYCIKYDASMATRVGLLDHLFTFKDRLSSIRFIVFDEIDKMNKLHQYGILNCVESGIMSETKFHRHRDIDVRGSTFFGTSNEIDKVYAPLRSRFLVLNMPKYTESEFKTVSIRLLNRRFNLPMSRCEAILKVVTTELEDKTIRDILRLGTLCNNSQDISDMITVFKDHRLDFD